LHPSDVAKLVKQLEGLVEAGNTVIVVEHDMGVAAASDWIIDIVSRSRGRGRKDCRSGNAATGRGRFPDPHGAVPFAIYRLAALAPNLKLEWRDRDGYLPVR
jgi:hypothetical protein